MRKQCLTSRLSAIICISQSLIFAWQAACTKLIKSADMSNLRVLPLWKSTALQLLTESCHLSQFSHCYLDVPLALELEWSYWTSTWSYSMAHVHKSVEFSAYAAAWTDSNRVALSVLYTEYNVHYTLSVQCSIPTCRMQCHMLASTGPTGEANGFPNRSWTAKLSQLALLKNSIEAGILWSGKGM